MPSVYSPSNKLYRKHHVIPRYSRVTLFMVLSEIILKRQGLGNMTLTAAFRIIRCHEKVSLTCRWKSMLNCSFLPLMQEIKMVEGDGGKLCRNPDRIA